MKIKPSHLVDDECDVIGCNEQAQFYETGSGVSCVRTLFYCKKHFVEKVNKLVDYLREKNIYASCYGIAKGK